MSAGKARPVRSQEIFAADLEAGDVVIHDGMIASVVSVREADDYVVLITAHSSMGGMVTRIRESLRKSEQVTVVSL